MHKIVRYRRNYARNYPACLPDNNHNHPRLPYSEYADGVVSAQQGHWIRKSMDIRIHPMIGPVPVRTCMGVGAKITC